VYRTAFNAQFQELGIECCPVHLDINFPICNSAEKESLSESSEMLKIDSVVNYLHKPKPEFVGVDVNNDHLVTISRKKNHT